MWPRALLTTWRLLNQVVAPFVVVIHVGRSSEREEAGERRLSSGWECPKAGSTASWHISAARLDARSGTAGRLPPGHKSLSQASNMLPEIAVQ